MMSIALLIMLIGYASAQNAQLNQGLELLQQMYKYHRFEYYNHRNSLIGLIFTTYASILFLIPLNVSGFYLTWCLAGYQEHYDVPASYAFFD